MKSPNKVQNQKIIHVLHKKFQIPKLALKRYCKGKDLPFIFAEHALVTLIGIEDSLSFILRNSQELPVLLAQG